MQVKKKRKNKSKSKDKHVYRQRERERQTDRQTDWLKECAREERAQRIESERRRALWHFVIWFVCWQHVANAGLATRAWEIEHTNSCLCVLAFIHMHVTIVAERDFSNRFTLTFDARYLFVRICCCCYAKLGFISSNDVTAHWQHCKTLHCLPLWLSVCLSLSQLLFLFWFSSDMATAAWLSNDLVACFFFGATLRPCQCVENCICCGPQ